MSKQSPTQLMSRAAFSRLAGVSGAMVSKLCRPGGKLAPALVNDRVDARNPAARAYLKSRGKRPPKAKSEKPAPAAESKPKAPSRPRPRRVPPGPPEDDDDEVSLDRIEPYASMTLRELVDRFGSDRHFKDWLEALLKIENVRKTRLANDVTEGELIARELVQTHVFGALEGLAQRLLVDLPRTMQARLYAAAKSDTPAEEGERIARDLISKQLKPVKARAIRVLRDA